MIDMQTFKLTNMTVVYLGAGIYEVTAADGYQLRNRKTGNTHTGKVTTREYTDIEAIEGEAGNPQKQSGKPSKKKAAKAIKE